MTTSSVGGLITGVRIAKTRKGDLMAGLVIEDMQGRVEAAVFPEAYKRLHEKVKLEIPVLVKAAVKVEEDAAPKLFINEITPLDEAQGEAAALAADFDSTAGGAAGDGGCAAWAVHALEGRCQGAVRFGASGRVCRGDGS